MYYYLIQVFELDWMGLGGIDPSNVNEASKLSKTNEQSF